MATAPFQLWLDIAPIESAIRSSGTVTVTTASPHGITTGAYVQMAGATGTPGTSMNGVYEITKTSGSTFTYSSSGTAGTGLTGTAVISYDLTNPLINYSGTAKDEALYVSTDAIRFSVSGDGSGASSTIQVFQDDTPSDGPWYKLIPDQSRIRLVRTNTGTTPADNGSDVLFTSAIISLSAELLGSGQGTMTDVQLQDATSLLERVFVFTDGKQEKLIVPSGVVRSGGTATVTTNVSHGLSNGGTVTIQNVTGGGTASFYDLTAVVADATTNTFTYANPGADATGNIPISISSGSAFGMAGTQVLFQLPAGSNVQSGAVIISGVVAQTVGAQNLINGIFDSFTTSGLDTVIIQTAGTVDGGFPLDVSSATLSQIARVIPAGTLAAPGIRIAGTATEQAAVIKALSSVNNVKSYDAPLQRLFNTAGTTYIAGSNTATLKEDIEIGVTSVRDVLDQLASAYAGVDGLPRRYFVDAIGNLHYELAGTASQPTYATAPYKLITSGTANPNTTIAAATLMPYDLKIGYDYQTIKSGVLSNAFGTAFVPHITTYLNYGYAERKNAPHFDSTFDGEDVTSGYLRNEYTAAKSYFGQAHIPLLSGYVTIRGAGTAAHNIYGFNAGYAQTGAYTFALVEGWRPGQWVDITSHELGLSGMFRVEQVDWGLERGSFTQVVAITFSYKPVSTLSNQIAQVR
jgi:hypothetical protein